jgi:hypothetical protein
MVAGDPVESHSFSVSQPQTLMMRSGGKLSVILNQMFLKS